jgi:hypothetical protein
MAYPTSVLSWTSLTGTTQRNAAPTLSTRLNALATELQSLESVLLPNPAIDAYGTDWTTLNARLGAIDGAWISWTPVLTGSTTNPTLGTGGVAYGRYKQVGKHVHFYGGVKWGNAGNSGGSGFILLTLPVAANAAGITAGLPSLVSGEYRLNAQAGLVAGSSIMGNIEIYSGGTSACFLVPPYAAVTTELLDEADPIQLGNNGDALIFRGSYEAL